MSDAEFWDLSPVELRALTERLDARRGAVPQSRAAPAPPQPPGPLKMSADMLKALAAKYGGSVTQKAPSA